MSDLHNNIRNRRLELGLSQEELAKRLGYKSRSAINKIELGINDLTQTKIVAFAKALETTPTELMGYSETSHPFPEPNITEECATFKIIGNVAAGYNGIAEEQYDGDDIDIPISYLRGRPQSDFFVLRVKGQSMYPEYRDGDIVLVLKTPTLEFSGDIGVVLYDGEMATLKKVEFVMGEDWMRLIPLNPAFETKTIKNEELEQCQILGVPKLLIRPINNF